MTHSFRLLLAFTVALGLSACGGGDTAAADAGTGTGTAPPPSGTPNEPAPAPGPPTSHCPSTGVDAMWIGNRLGCFGLGARVIDIASGASGVASDVSFVVAQRVLDRGFNNVLGPEIKRHYSRLLCVRYAPEGLTDGSYRISLASDLVVALRSSGALPEQYQTFMELSGGNQPGFVREPCDPSRHPLIVNYLTGRIESIQPAAMAAVSVYDMP